MITGFLPKPARSIVKLGGSQHDFFTIAQLLSKQQYSTAFIYGGEAHFDNMKRFSRRMGLTIFLMKRIMKPPTFTVLGEYLTKIYSIKRMTLLVVIIMRDSLFLV